MKTSRILALAATLFVASVSFTQAHELGDIKRTDLSRNDLSIPSREAMQVLVEFAPGVNAARHAHPGEELVYVVEGAIEYRLDGKAAVTLKAGEVLFVPAGVAHSAKNVGSERAIELATYIVAKDKPLVTLSE